MPIYIIRCPKIEIETFHISMMLNIYGSVDIVIIASS